MRLPRLLVVLALLIVSACGNESPGAIRPGPAVIAEPTTYVVTGITDAGKRRDPVPGTEIRLAFADGELRITAGCNSMSGRYTLAGTRLSVEPLATTEMGCDQRRMEQDAWVAGLFEEPVQYTADSIISNDVVLSLTDREQVSPDKPLAGTVWELDTWGTAGADGVSSSVPAGVVAAFRIDERGAIRYFNGCQAGTGRVEIEGDRIAQRPGGGQDLNACNDRDKQAVSAAMGEVLRSWPRFVVEEQRLTLTAGDRVLGFRAVGEFPSP